MGNTNVITREDAYQTNMMTVSKNTVVGELKEPIAVFVVRARLKNALRTLISRRFNFHVTDHDGNTPLHHASEIADMVVPLLPLSNVFSQNNFGHTPLSIAVMNQHYDAIPFLKDAMYKRDLNGNGPIHYAIELGDTDMVKCLVRCSPALSKFSVFEPEEYHLNHFCNENKESPLCMAVKRMDEPMVKTLVDLGAIATDKVKVALVSHGKTDESIRMYGTLVQDTDVNRNVKTDADKYTGLLSGENKYVLF